MGGVASNPHGRSARQPRERRDQGRMGQGEGWGVGGSASLLGCALASPGKDMPLRGWGGRGGGGWPDAKMGVLNCKVGQSMPVSAVVLMKLK